MNAMTFGRPVDTIDTLTPDHLAAAFGPLWALTWYVLRVTPGREFATALLLRRGGYCVFVPVRHALRRKTHYCRQRTAVKFPLLPGYVLIGFADPTPPWLRLFAYQAVQAVIGVDGCPRALPFDSVRRLFQLHTSESHPASNAQLLMHTAREFEIGDRVKVIDGPMSGYSVTVRDLNGIRARVVLELFDRETEAEIRLDRLEPDL